jgi:2-amino-4-hydroxy-6-hydroxymethyldihydropteridine diphosphokinase
MIIIGFGANLDGKYGSPENALRACAQNFAAHGIRILAASHIWESAPVPVSDQPWYKNAVCIVETALSPHDLLKALNLMEHEAGRIRTTQNAARVIDLDLLAYHDVQIDDKVLNLPHPELHNRAFVLYPLSEIAPNWMHPTLNKPVDALVSNLPTGQEIRKISGDKLYPVAVDKDQKVSA